MAGLSEVAQAAGLRVEYVEQVFEAVIRVLLQSEGRRQVVIRGFGTFTLRHQAARVITTPQIPGGRAETPERMKLHFRPSLATREVLNGGSAGLAKGVPAKADPKQVVVKSRKRKQKTDAEMEAAVEEMAANIETTDEETEE